MLRYECQGAATSMNVSFRVAVASYDHLQSLKLQMLIVGRAVAGLGGKFLALLTLSLILTMDGLCRINRRGLMGSLLHHCWADHPTGEAARSIRIVWSRLFVGVGRRSRNWRQVPFRRQTVTNPLTIFWHRCIH